MKARALGRSSAERAFDKVFRTERSKLVALAWSMTGREDAAVDLVQEVFLSAFADWERISQFDSVGAWLRRVTINRSISWQRRASNEREVVEKLGYITAIDRPVSAAATTASAAGALDDDGFWSLVRELAPRQQAVIVLRYVEDLSVEETAAVLEIEVGTVKSAAAAGRRRLAAALEAHPDRERMEENRG